MTLWQMSDGNRPMSLEDCSSSYVEDRLERQEKGNSSGKPPTEEDGRMLEESSFHYGLKQERQGLTGMRSFITYIWGRG